jgi:hypothetical protein
MFDGGVWGLVKLKGTAAPDVNTNRAERGRIWPQPSALSRTRFERGWRIAFDRPSRSRSETLAASARLIG